MDTAESGKSRVYKVVLTDRTTSPKVNRYLRDLLGISVWDASSLMNKVPSIIQDGIQLHRAIEIKSQLGRFGLTAKIESIGGKVDDAKEPEAAGGKTAAKPEPVKPRKVSKPKSTGQPIFAKPTPPKPPSSAKPKSAGQPLFAKASPPKPVPAAQPKRPSRLTSRILIRTPVLKIMIPFIVLLIVVIIIIFIGESRPGIDFLSKGNIVQKQERGAGKPQKKFVPSKEDLIARVKDPRSEQTSPSGGVSADGSEGGGSPSGAGGQGGGYTGSGAGAGAGGAGAGGGGAGAGGGGAGSGAGGAGAGSGAVGAGAGAGGMPGSGKVKLPSEAMAGLDRLGEREGAGLSNDKFRELLEDARKALKNPQSRDVVSDYNRLQMAGMMRDELSPSTADMLDGSEFANLNEQLKRSAQKQKLEPGVDLYPEITGAGIKIQTNLPDAAMVKVIIKVAGSKESMEFEIPVDMGTIEIPHEGGFPSGKITVRVILLPLRDQLDEVVEAIGRNGENLKGGYVKGKGKLDYEGFLNNRIARTRGEISKDEAESELRGIMAMQGMENAQLSEFEDFAFDRKIFVTISADGVDETDFIWKACRSTGLLTEEMDEPPKFLRLVVNGGQYFIPTYKCRKMLREYREDDPAGFDYLVNNIILL